MRTASAGVALAVALVAAAPATAEIVRKKDRRAGVTFRLAGARATTSRS